MEKFPHYITVTSLSVLAVTSPFMPNSEDTEDMFYKGQNYSQAASAAESA